MPLPAYRTQHHHRDRSRLALLLSHRRHRTTVAGLIAACVIYSFAFFKCQPDQSFLKIQERNHLLAVQYKLRQEQKKARRRGEYVPVVALPDSIIDDGPEWQRKMRAGAGEMAWKREQEQLGGFGGVGMNNKMEEARDSYYLRGTHDSAEDEENQQNKESKIRASRQRRAEQSSAEALLDFILAIFLLRFIRSVLRLCVQYRQFVREMELEEEGTEGDNTPTRNGTRRSTTTRNASGRSALANLMVPRSMRAHAALLRNARFRAFTQQVNEQRAVNGQPPLSAESLRLMMRESDFSSNDYEALQQFEDEAASHDRPMGASQEEINNICPQRTLTDPNDELLTTHPRHAHQYPHSQGNPGQECSICLEAYALNDQVRRLPCCHDFHVQCIDHWLREKAVCPICKHRVLS